MNGRILRQTSWTLRCLCTEVPVARKLPDLASLVPTLPQQLQSDAIRLRNALGDANKITETASEYSSDSIDREEARAYTRRVLLLYKRLVEHSEKIGEFRGNLQSVTGNHEGTLASTPCQEKPKLGGKIEQVSSGNDTEVEQAQPNLAETERPGYSAPSAEDAFAPDLLNSSNPVVRTFAPHIADLKYRLFQSHRQRVWIGWGNWF